MSTSSKQTIFSASVTLKTAIGTPFVSELIIRADSTLNTADITSKTADYDL